MKSSQFLIAVALWASASAVHAGVDLGTRCDGTGQQAADAARGRDAGVPLEMYQSAMSPLSVLNSAATKQGHTILRDVFALKDWDPFTHKIVRLGICLADGKLGASAAEFPDSVKAAIGQCQSAHQEQAPRAECLADAMAPMFARP